jgi:ATP-dependent Clp protease ATP-binding subunit ClpC
MFEKYTEKARRVIFFARYEASQFGSMAIASEHILLGLLREDKRFFRDDYSRVEMIRKEIAEIFPKAPLIGPSVDLPLSQDAKRVLSYAADESDRLGHFHIGTEHLLIGILREENSVAAQVLKAHHISLDDAREYLTMEHGPDQPEQPAPELPTDMVIDKIESLINMLARRGGITQEELAGFAKGFRLLPYFQVRFLALVDLLVSKGVISEEEKQELFQPGEQSSGQ